MAAPQLVDDLGAGVVLEAPQVLQTERPDRLDLVVVEMGTKHHVGEDFQGRLEIAAQRRHRQRGVQRLGAFRVADSQIVERGQELAAVARAGPARDPFRGHRRRPAAQIQAVGPLVRRSRGQKQRERRRLHARHRLGDQHQPIGKCVLFHRWMKMRRTRAPRTLMDIRLASHAPSMARGHKSSRPALAVGDPIAGH